MRHILSGRQEFPSDGSSQDQLFFLLQYAICAPSVLNAQPWHFVVSDTTITINLPEGFAQPNLDPDWNYTAFTYGCVAENLKRAGRAYGLDFTISDVQASPLQVTLRLGEQRVPLAHEGDLVAITTRQSNRFPYTTEPLPEGLRSYITSLASDEHTISVVTDKDTRVRIGECVAQTTSELFKDPAVRAEVAEWKRTNSTKKKDGMPGFVMGIPKVVSYVFPWLLKKFNIGPKVAPKTLKVFADHTSDVVMINGVSSTMESWVQAGVMYQSIALEANKLGVVTSIHSAPVAVAVDELNTLFALSGVPQVLFRIGYPTQTAPHTARKSVDDVTTRI